MKKVLSTVTLCIALFFNSNTNAQQVTDDNIKKVRFGVKAGLNIANVSIYKTSTLNTTATQIDTDTNSIIDFHAGVTSEVSIFRRLSFQPELVFSRRGFNSNNRNVRLDYVSFPLMLKYYLVKDKMTLEAGTRFDFLTRDEGEFSDGQKVDLNAESNEVGLNLGIGYQLGSNFFTQVRYVSGGGDIDPSDFPADIHNNVFQISVGYQF